MAEAMGKAPIIASDVGTCRNSQDGKYGFWSSLIAIYPLLIALKI